MEICLFQETGLDKNYRNAIAHADFSAWVNDRRTRPTTKAFTVPARTFFDGDTLDITSFDNYSVYDYAVAIDGERVTGLFIEPVFADSTIARYSVTLDRWSALSYAQFVNFTIEQSTISDNRFGEIPLPFAGTGAYSISTRMSGKCWAIAFVSDSGTFSRGGTHSFVAVGPIDSSYDAYATAVDLARCTSVAAAGKTYTIDSVSGSYVIPADILPAAGSWGGRMISATIDTDTPGVLAYSGYFYDTSYSETLTAPASGVEHIASIIVPQSDYDKKVYFGNFSQFVEIPERQFASPTVSTVITPTGVLSVRVVVDGELYDFSDSLRVDAYYTGEDATTRAINAGSQLISAVGSVGLSAATGSKVAIASSAISAGGSIARTLSEGRAYSYRGGGFRAACTVAASSGGSPLTVLMPGLFILSYAAANSNERFKALKRYGRIYPRMINGAIALEEGKQLTYYRGSGTTFPAVGWLSDALSRGMTLWNSAGVNQV